MSSLPLLLLALFAQNVKADPGSDFSNNLFSDLAPLLALFGERFAQQFMSEAYSWLDCIIFAMAPLGIITAIVGAIRVGGYPWMRAVIGRGRENMANAEVELMSSTSHEVCELWNGESIVRTLGRPIVKQIIAIEGEHDVEVDGLKIYGLYTMEAAKKAKLLKRCQKPTADEETGDKIAQYTAQDEPEAPNILLNIHHGSTTGELLFAAITGTLLQMGVLVFSGFVAYYTQLQPKIPESDHQTTYGFPLLMIGTAILTVGLILVSLVIEQSTVEEKWVAERAEGEKTKVRVLWLQKKHVVGDQAFDSHIIATKESNEEILTSRRARDLNSQIGQVNTKTQALTFFGTVITLLGFILQFSGFRGLHWLSAISQLCATGIMAILRAYIRKSFIASPTVENVMEGHEIDTLAFNIASGSPGVFPPNVEKPAGSRTMFGQDRVEFYKNLKWTNTLAYTYPTMDPEDHRTPLEMRGQHAVEIGCRLRSLVNINDTHVSEQAMAVGEAIKVVLDTLYTAHKKFLWVFDLPLRGKVYQIRILVSREPSEENPGKTKWKIPSMMIESVLSLFLLNMKGSAKDTEGSNWSNSEGRSIKKKAQFIRSCNNDFAFWRNMELWGTVTQFRLERTALFIDEFFNGTNRDVIIGIRGTRVLSNQIESIHSDGYAAVYVSPLRASIESLLARHIFSAFMWSFAPHIPMDSFSRDVTFKTKDTFNIRDMQTWIHGGIVITSAKLQGLVAKIQQTGLVSHGEAAMFVFPPLSYAGLLPGEVSIDWFCRRLHENKRVNYETAIEELLGFVSFMGVYQEADFRKEVWIYKAIAVLVEFRLSATQYGFPIGTGHSRHRWPLRFTDLFTSVEKVLPGLRTLYESQGRGEDFTSLHIETSHIPPFTPINSVPLDDRLSALLGFNAEHITIVRDRKAPNMKCIREIPNPGITIRHGDILGWTPIHYASVLDEKFRESAWFWTLDPPRDIAGRTPLHYMVKYKEKNRNWSNFGDITLVHTDRKYLVKTLEPLDKYGMSPVHWAARYGNAEALRVFGRFQVAMDNFEKEDHFGRTPLMLAEQSKDEIAVKVVKEILRKEMERRKMSAEERELEAKWPNDLDSEEEVEEEEEGEEGEE